MKYNNNVKSSYTTYCLTLISLLATPFNSVDASDHQVVSARDVSAIHTKQIRAIEEGVRIGQLTPKEASTLRKEQHEITNLEQAMKEDGVFEASELGNLFKKLECAQNHINKLLRNNISTHGVMATPHSH